MVKWVKRHIWTASKHKETKNRGTRDEFSWRDPTFVHKVQYRAKNRGNYRSRRYG